MASGLTCNLLQILTHIYRGHQDLYTELFLNHHLMSMPTNSRPGLDLLSHTKRPDFLGWVSTVTPTLLVSPSPLQLLVPFLPLIPGIRARPHSREEGGEGVRAPVAARGVDSRFLGGVIKMFTNTPFSREQLSTILGNSEFPQA